MRQGNYKARATGGNRINPIKRGLLRNMCQQTTAKSGIEGSKYQNNFGFVDGLTGHIVGEAEQRVASVMPNFDYNHDPRSSLHVRSVTLEPIKVGSFVEMRVTIGTTAHGDAILGLRYKETK